MSKKKATITYPDITSTVSATETTGLIPDDPQNEAEYEAYEDLSGLEIPRRTRTK